MVKGKPIAAIIGGGLSKFGRLDGKYAREIFGEAAIEVFDRIPNLDPIKEIQALFVGQMSDFFEHQGHVAPIMSEWAGLRDIPCFHLEGACASSGIALASGLTAIASGLYDIVLVGGVEKMTHRTTGDITEILAVASDFPTEQWNGLTFPGAFAIMANAHVSEYGTTEEQMAKVAVKNHRNASKNPKAHMPKEVTLEQVLTSRMVASPLKLLDCSLISDGAACLILTKPHIARKYTDTPVFVTGVGQASDTIALWERDDLTSFSATKLAAPKAHRLSKTRTKDVDVAEVHDCFTIAELMAYEDLGFCKKGKGGRMIDEGLTEIDSDLPVNPSGGLKAKGHPVGATGAAQACEIYLQLTNQAGRRQVPNPSVGLTHNLGGSGATCVVHVYERGD